MKSNNPQAKLWNTLSSRHVLKDQWISVRADACLMPSGITLDPYYVLEYPDWVHIVALDEDEKLLVTRQYRHGRKRVFLELPCGAINAGESPESGARRELMEETGVTFVTVKKIGAFSPNPATHSNLVHVFLCQGTYSIQSPSQDETEDVDFEFLPLGVVRAAIKTGEFGQGLHIASLYLGLTVVGNAE